MTIHSDLLQLKQLNSMEILIYFILKTIKCDRSTWPARRKVDRSTPKSVRTLSVDRPWFRALVHCSHYSLNGIFTPLRVIFNPPDVTRTAFIFKQLRLIAVQPEQERKLIFFSKEDSKIPPISWILLGEISSFQTFRSDFQLSVESNFAFALVLL